MDLTKRKEPMGGAEKEAEYFAWEGGSVSLGHHAACTWAEQIQPSQHAKQELPHPILPYYSEWRVEASWVFFSTFPPIKEQLNCFEVEQDSA